MLRMHDLFAGAGGSSTGAISVPGVSVRLAANHWQKACDVHNLNHPNTDHLCADISQYDPRRLPAADILWASPECTNHSQAKGRKRVDAGQPDLFEETLPDEAAERSRATMWDVPRFTEAHGYRAIIVENVVDAAKWTPFRAWLMAMDAYGYEHQIVCLNSMHAQARGLPAPQSRDRMYVVFWRKGDRKPDLEGMQRPRAWCPRCEKVVESRQAWKPGRTVGRYRQQYVYVCGTPTCGQIVEPGWLPAYTAIDWTLPGQRIGDRDKPLAEKTRRRIAAGIARYWHPIHLEAAGHTYDAADPKHKSYDDPNGYYRAWSAYDALKTLHTIESKALAIPAARDEEPGYPGGKCAECGCSIDYHDSGDFCAGPCGGNRCHGRQPLAPPFIAELRGGGSDARPVTEPAATFCASGNHHGLVMPYYGNSDSARPDTDALGTVTTRDRHALIMRNNTARGDQGQMTTPADEVLRTLTTAGHQSVLTPGDLEAAQAQVDDCLFRMLEPHEVAAGMAFPKAYQWDGTRRERVRMAGNAVTPPAARDLVGAVVDSLS